MVQLRVDVDAARARQQFNAASRSVDNLRASVTGAEQAAARFNGELTDTQARLTQTRTALVQAEQASEDAALEVHRLRQQVEALGSAAPEALVRQLHQAERAAEATRREEERLRTAVAETTVEAARLQAQFEETSDEAQQLRNRLVQAVVPAEALRHALRQAERNAQGIGNAGARGLLGFRQQVNQALQVNGRGLRDSLREAWNSMPVEVKAAIIGAGVSMATILAGAIGAVLNAALLSVVGVGVLAAVVAVAAKTSSAVRTAFSDTFAPIGDEIAAFARDVAEGPLIKAAEIFGQTWEDIATDVQGAFGDIGKHIEPLAAGLAQLVENVMPGLREGLKAAGPVLDELAAALPAIGTAISDMFHDLSEDGAAQGAVKGMRVLAATVIGVFRTIGVVVGWLSRQFNTTTMFVADMLTLLSKIPVIGKMFEGAAASARDFANAGSGTGRSLEETGVAADQTASAMRRQADATKSAANAAQDLSAKMAHIIDVELGAKDAAIAFEAALDAVTESAKENGRSLDIGTEKGRANASTILDGVRAAEAKRQADIEMAGGVNASAAAVGAANAQYEAMVAKLRAAAYAAGFNKAQVDALIGSLNRIPASKTTIVTTEYRTKGNIPKDQMVGSGKGWAGYASGTPSAPAGWAWVGEQGPELMKFKGGETVLNSMESARAAGARSAVSRPMGGGTAAVQVQLVQSRTGAGGGLDALFGKWLDDALFSGRIRLQVVNGRVQPV